MSASFLNFWLKCSILSLKFQKKKNSQSMSNFKFRSSLSKRQLTIASSCSRQIQTEKKLRRGSWIEGQIFWKNEYRSFYFIGESYDTNDEKLQTVNALEIEQIVLKSTCDELEGLLMLKITDISAQNLSGSRKFNSKYHTLTQMWHTVSFRILAIYEFFNGGLNFWKGLLLQISFFSPVLIKNLNSFPEKQFLQEAASWKSWNLNNSVLSGDIGTTHAFPKAQIESKADFPNKVEKNISKTKLNRNPILVKKN